MTKNRTRDRARRSVMPPLPNLVPLINVMFVLVAFVLGMPHSGAALLCGCGHKHVPAAQHTAPLDEGTVGTVLEVRLGIDVDEIPERLARARRDAALLHPDEPFDDRVILEVAARTPMGLVHEVIATCARAGYPRYQLAVMRHFALTD